MKPSDNRPRSEARRRLLAGAAGAGALAALGPRRILAAPVGSMAELGFAELPDGALAEQILYALPGKVPLIKKTYRPPNFETPIQYLRTVITPNDAFFVRWHLAAIPEVSVAQWKLSVGGESVEKPRSYTMAELKNGFPQASVTAVC